MQSVYKLLLLIVLTLPGCSGYRNSDHTIEVQFEVDGEKFDISDNFKMSFLQNDKMLEAKVKGNYLILPEFSDNKSMTVFFAYKSFKFNFKEVLKSELYADQNMEWDFKILNKDFGQISTELATEPLKKLYVWEFNPQEHGDGIEIAVPIYK
jgi:hypothetical protein